MRVQFGRTVFVTHAQTQREIAPQLPFVLEEPANIFRTDVARCRRILNKLVGQTEHEVGVIVLRIRAAGASDTDKVELAVDVEIIHGVVLVRRVCSARFECVSALDPGQRIGPRERIVDQRCGSLRAKTDSHAAGEIQDRRPGRIVRRNSNPQFTRSR